jgi:hypothetical protein
MKIKPKAKSATTPPKISSELRGWPSIAQFLGLPDSTVHRWAKEGMPVRRESRNVVANPEELNQWVQRTSGEAAGVHVITPSSDLLKDLRSSLTAHKEAKDCFREPKTKRERPAPKTSKTKGARKPLPSDRRFLAVQISNMAVLRCIPPFEVGEEAMPHGNSDSNQTRADTESSSPPQGQCIMRERPVYAMGQRRTEGTGRQIS